MMTRVVGAVIFVLGVMTFIIAAVGFGLGALYLALVTPLGSILAALVTAGASLTIAIALAALGRRARPSRRQANPTTTARAVVHEFPLESTAAALAVGFAVGASPESRRAAMSTLAVAARELTAQD